MGKNSNWFGAKTAVKHLVQFVPGYNWMMLGLSRVLPERSWVRRIPIARQDVRVLVGGFEIWLVKPDRCEIAKQLFWTHGVRVPKEDEIALDLFRSLSVDSDLVLDIGSNTGLFSLVAAKANPKARILGFDIVPEAVELFLANVVRNDSATIVPMLRGIGRPGTSFRVPASMGGSSLPSSVSTQFRYESGIDVPIISLDSLVDQAAAGSKVLIKIDVEGTEENIFANGGGFLDAHRPIILCEVLKRAAVSQYETILTSRGYKLYLVTDQGLARKSELKPDPRFKDWLFTTQEFPEGTGRTH